MLSKKLRKLRFHYHIICLLIILFVFASFLVRGLRVVSRQGGQYPFQICVIAPPV